MKALLSFRAPPCFFFIGNLETSGNESLLRLCQRPNKITSFDRCIEQCVHLWSLTPILSTQREERIRDRQESCLCFGRQQCAIYNCKSTNKHRCAMANASKTVLAQSFPVENERWLSKKVHSVFGNWFQFFSSRLCKSLYDVKRKAQLELCAPWQLGS